MGKGQKLADGETGSFTDMTVEDILRIVFKLAPQESTVPAVEKVCVCVCARACACT